MTRTDPPWLALARQQIGLAEIAGAKHESRIVRFFADIGSKFRDDETPWCAAFVGAMLERAGVTSTRKEAARSYLNWGAKLAFPVLGCVVVFERPPSTWSGHVGFVVGVDAFDNLMTLGGNQGNVVSIAPFKRARVLGYRWPPATTYPNAQPLDLPLLSSTGVVSSQEQ
jgi:uncharacterized protein (TIGR02594 family)